MTTPTRPFYPQEGPLWPEPEKPQPYAFKVERLTAEDLAAIRAQGTGRVVMVDPPKRAPWTNREVAEYQALVGATECFELSMLDWASRDH